MTRYSAKTAAIVVGYFPEENVLRNLLHALCMQSDYVFLVDNGGCEALAQIELPNYIYLKQAGNLGLGHALNRGFAAALEKDVAYVATFDQDSAPPPDLIPSLLQQHLNLQQRLIKCAAVGPTFFDRRESEKIYSPFYRQNHFRIDTLRPVAGQTATMEVDVLITSGTLINMEVWRNGLQYDENLFIDYTDTEWCFRVRNKGYQLFACPSVEMGHALSDAPPVRIFGLNFFHYSALRRYYYFRNTILLCKKNYVSVPWKRRLLIGLMLRLVFGVVYENKPMNQLRMMCKGFFSGIRNRSGAYQP
jgi:rhamnosyltransferase